MITARDVQPLVATPEFKRLLKASEAEPASRAHRCLKGLDRLARGITQRDERNDKLRRRHETSQAPGHAPRRSLKETADGHAQHVPL